jgi:hypothetical protein
MRAHERLVETLIDMGWVVVDVGPNWFDRALEPKPISKPSVSVPVAQPTVD